MKIFYNLKINNLLHAFGGPSAGTKYDLTNACMHCGTGAEPIGARFITGLKTAKKRIFYALDREVMVDLTLFKQLVQIGVNSFAEVYNSNGAQLPFMELRGEAILPPFSSQTKVYLKEGECAFCKRNGYFHDHPKELHLIYENIDSSLWNKNILITYERFGYSKLRNPFSESGFASPLFIVSEPVKYVIESEKIKNVSFVPVKILQSHQSE